MAPTDAQFLEVEPTYKCFKRNPTQNGSQMKPDDYEMDQEYSSELEEALERVYFKLVKVNR